MLLYGVEALPPTKSDRNILDFTYSTAFFKNFHVKEATTIKLCQFYSRCLPTTYRLDMRKISFFNGLSISKDSIPLLLSLLLGMDDQVNLFNKYKISPRDSIAVINRNIWKVFESDLKL